jgi:hypothetical protein
MLIVGTVLKMTDYTKEQVIGTICITCAILMLPDVGPQEQPVEDVMVLIGAPLAVIWTIVLFAATIASCLGMVFLFRMTEPPALSSLVVCLAAQVVSAVIGTSVSKMFPLAPGLVVLVVFIVLAIFFALINVVSLVLAAKTCDQSIFVPAQTCATLLINMVTGLVVWEDYTGITMPLAYVMVYCVMLLGIALLAPNDEMTIYKNTKKLEITKAIVTTGHADMKQISSTRIPAVSAAPRLALLSESHLTHISPTSRPRGWAIDAALAEWRPIVRSRPAGTLAGRTRLCAHQPHLHRLLACLCGANEQREHRGPLASSSGQRGDACVEDDSRPRAHRARHVLPAVARRARIVRLVAPRLVLGLAARLRCRAAERSSWLLAAEDRLGRSAVSAGVGGLQ